MNQAFARTYVDFWTGATGIELARRGEEGARSLAHFLISGPNCHPLGLYRKPIEVLVYEFKRPPAGDFARAERDVRHWLDILAELDYAEVDEENGYLWVKEMAAYQFRPLPWKPTNNLIQTARRWYSMLGRNRFLSAYFDRYDIDMHLSNPFAFPGSQVERREWVPPVKPTQPKLLDDVVDIATVPPAAALAIRVKHCGEPEFAVWWAAYPAHRRKARKACLATWLRKRIPVEKLPRMLALLEAQKRAIDWRKNDGRFIPLPLTYINQERYDDETAGMAHGGLNPTNEVTANTLQELMQDMADE